MRDGRNSALRGFEFPEDLAYFAHLIGTTPDEMGLFLELFDFRDAQQKRREFNRRRNALYLQLVADRGPRCELRLSANCQPDRPTQIDHLIPLKTNILNKELRRMQARPGRKVSAQSFGSNAVRNLYLACAPCNAAKKHWLLDAADFARILRTASA